MSIDYDNDLNDHYVSLLEVLRLFQYNFRNFKRLLTDIVQMLSAQSTQIFFISVNND